MKSFLLSSALVTLASAQSSTTGNPCPLLGQTPPKNTDSFTSYVIDSFNGEPFPFAFGRCNPTGIGVPLYEKPTCNADGDMVITTYSDPSCTTVATTEVYNETIIPGGQGSGHLGDYMCSLSSADQVGTNVEFAAGLCGGVKANFYGATHVCVRFDLEIGTDLMLYCDADGTEMQYYIGGLNCADAVYCRKFTASLDCGYMFSIPEGPGIYGKQTECSASYPAPAPTEEPKSSASALTMGTAALWSILALMH